MNNYRSVGCSQEDHLPNCAHFGYCGGYLTPHAKTCPCNKSNKAECNCNPTARELAKQNADPRLIAAKNIPQQPQAQYSNSEQFAILIVAANKLGLYDAADILTRLAK